MDVSFPLMLRLGLDVGLVIVFHGRVIVLVGMDGRHVFPLDAMTQVMHHVSVVVGVNDGVMCVLHSDLLVTVLRREPAGRPGSVLETPALPERGWLGPAIPSGLVPGMAPRLVPGGDDLVSNWSGRGSRAGRVVDRGERVSL
jgi:hypothetical protein